MKTAALTTYRRITQVLFIMIIFLVPVLNISRYDTATHELIIFGNVWSLGLREGFFADHSMRGSLHILVQFLLKALLPWIIILSIFPLLGYFTGRFFCGWLCPKGALFEWSDFLTLRLLGRRSLYGRKPNDPSVSRTNKIAYALVALASASIIPVLGGVALTGYFIAPKTIWHQISTGSFTFGVKAGIIGVSIYMLITSIFVRHVLCRSICAVGLMQMLFGWISPFSLRLKMDTARISACSDCKGCDYACFMNVTPRKNKRDISCVNCGACIEACRRELGEKALFHFDFCGRHAAPRKDQGDMSIKEPLGT